MKTETDDSYKVIEGNIQQIDVLNVYMRKSLKPILGPIENADYPRVLSLAALFTVLLNDQARHTVLKDILQDQLGVNILDMVPQQMIQVLQMIQHAFQSFF